MRRMTRPEIEACGAAMPATMAFHDQLIGAKLIQVTSRRNAVKPQPILHLTGEVTLAMQYDDEGNPGECEWQVCDINGNPYVSITVHDLLRSHVTGVGYFADPGNDLRPVIPYVEFNDLFCLCAMCSEGGAVIHHHRADVNKWDLFCELRPKPERTLSCTQKLTARN
jgi:hypothetical protein